MHPDTLKKIKAMVEFIKDFQVETECSPSLAEIGAHLGCTDSYVTRLLNLAQQRQLLKRNYGKVREITIL